MNHDEPLTLQQRAKLCEALHIGCCRETACHFVGVTVAQLQAEIAHHDDFARALNHAEARAELRHMANVHRASQDDKNWRTSVWWLEQRAAARAAQSSDADHGKMTELIDNLAQAIVAEVTDPSVQRRLIERLWKVLDGEDKPGPVVIEGKVLSGPSPAEEDDELASHAAADAQEVSP